MGTVTPIRQPLKQGSFDPDSFASSYSNLKAVIDEMQLDKADGNSPRTKIIACPTYLICEYQHIHAECHLERGAILSAFIYQGLVEIGELTGIKELDKICNLIRLADSTVLTLQARAALRKNVGSSQKPGIIIKHTVPCGDTETLQFRHAAKYKNKLNSRAEELGLYVSPLAIIALGMGMLRLCDGEGLDDESRYSIQTDRDQLDEKAQEQATELTVLYDFYRARASKIGAGGKRVGRPPKRLTDRKVEN